MTAEYEQYIPEIQALNLEITYAHKECVQRLFGKSILDPATPQEMQRSYDYMHSGKKALVERGLAQLALFWGGKFIIQQSERAVNRIDGQGGLYYLEVGFPGVEKTTFIPKIRTMRVGADTEIESPFGQTSFVAGLGYETDGRVLKSKTVYSLRESGLDELKQLGLVRSGKMALVGLRAYTMPELRGIEILENLRDDPKLGFDPEVRELLRMHKGIIQEFQPAPALFGMLSGYADSGSTPHMVRMLFDTTYPRKVTPQLDFLIVKRSIERRIEKVVGVR